MAIEAKLTDPDSGHTLVLDDRKKNLVLVELERVRRFSAPYRQDTLPIAADCTLEIDNNGRKREYWVLSETVLLDVHRKRVAQFYMGIELIRWLRSP